MRRGWGGRMGPGRNGGVGGDSDAAEDDPLEDGLEDSAEGDVAVEADVGDSAGEDAGRERGMRPRMRRRFAPGAWADWEGAGHSLGTAEELLVAGSLLIGWEDGPGRFVAPDNATYVLETLLCDAMPDEKVQSLVEGRFARLSPSQWTDLVEDFQPTPALRERVAEAVEEDRRIVEGNHALHEQLMSAQIFRSEPVKYAVTILAMGLTVVAFGSLLSYRPAQRARWAEFDTDGDGVPIVLRNVAILFMLGVFDLALTLIAQQTGGFLEMNPLGGELIENPGALSAFKIVTLLGACFILVSLRRYRGAQIASWWLCLVCTVLTFRWLTYNSMFMA